MSGRVSIRQQTPILLASASPRRRDILRGLGLQFVVRPTAVEEVQHPGDTPESYLERVVADKLRAAEHPDETEAFACVLVADTIVVLGDQILGKPQDTADAERLVASLCGRTHRVLTRFAISAKGDGGGTEPGQWVQTVESKVTLRSATKDEVARYAKTGEGMDKAGGYAVQGLGAFLVSRIDGSFTNVVGLPACEVVQCLTQAGLLSHFPRVT